MLYCKDGFTMCTQGTLPREDGRLWASPVTMAQHVWSLSSRTAAQDTSGLSDAHTHNLFSQML